VCNLDAPTLTHIPWQAIQSYNHIPHTVVYIFCVLCRSAALVARYVDWILCRPHQKVVHTHTLALGQKPHGYTDTQIHTDARIHSRTLLSHLPTLLNKVKWRVCVCVWGCVFLCACHKAGFILLLFYLLPLRFAPRFMYAKNFTLSFSPYDSVPLFLSLVRFIFLLNCK